MRKILLLLILVIGSQLIVINYVFGNEKGFSLKGAYSLGSNYSATLVSVMYKDPEFLNFGLDGQLFSYVENEVTSSSYMGFVYTANELFQKKKLTADWLLGLTIAQAQYETLTTDTVTTLGLGIVCECMLSSKLLFDGKVLAILYSNGYSFPYQLGLTFKLGVIDISAGIQGMANMLTTPGITAINMGTMLGVGFNF